MSKNILNIILLIVGLILLFIGGFVFQGEALKAISGIFIGLGAGLFGLSCANLWMLSYSKKHPDIMAQSNIDLADERNIMIRNKAKAKSADFMQWCLMGLAFLSILIDSPLWVTLLIIGIFLLKNVIEYYFFGKYQKEM